MKADLGRVGLVAIPRESRPLLDAFQQSERVQWGETILRTGQILSPGAAPPSEARLVALAEVLPGPVNAALGAQALVARYTVDALIGFGSAGALDPGLSPGDLVIARNAIAHDAGLFQGSHFEPFGIMGRDEQDRIGYRRQFKADPDLVTRALAAAQKLDGQAVVGTVVTGNQVILSTARNRWLGHTFDALAVEMETAAVAQVAVAHRIPWVGVRAVSDAASDDLYLDYERLRDYFDDQRPSWQRNLDRWLYLLVHPQARRRLNRLRQGLALASWQAAAVVASMLGAATRIDAPS